MFSNVLVGVDGRQGGRGAIALAKLLATRDASCTGAARSPRRKRSTNRSSGADHGCGKPTVKRRIFTWSREGRTTMPRPPRGATITGYQRHDHSAALPRS